MNLQQQINHNQNLCEFSETEAINLKKVASFFQDTIHFHPGQLQPKTLIFTVRALVEKFYTKVDPYFWVFTGMSTSFGFFKVTLKMVTEPLYKGTREFSVLFPMASIFFRKLLKTVCFDCEMTLFRQNLLKAVCFGQNGFF